MSSVRLRARIVTATSLGPARLDGWRFSCTKTGSDGSAKATILRDPEAHVWGVLFELPHADLSTLDRFEGGYERIEVEVRTSDALVSCHTYISERISSELAPYDWYKRHMLTGALEHGLPDEWQVMLESIPCRSH